MDPKMLVDTTMATPLPAPFWFVDLFKVLGFTLHAVPMNLWYAGVVVAMLLYAFGGDQARRFSCRLMTQMPVILAFGINLGVVPLLFLQVAYAKVFYPATVLMAWFWFAVILVLIPAYYGVYVYSFGVRDRGGRMPHLWRAAGWAAAIFLLWIGFTFNNALSLTTNIQGWPALWHQHSVAGAALGTALNMADATLWPRWLMFFGLALTTTAMWMIFDAGWFARRESAEYQHWVQKFALKLDTIGLVWFALAGSWYVFGTWRPEARETMFFSPWVVLTICTALAPGLPWLLILWLGRRGDTPVGRGWATLLGLAQFGVLGINAISRQIVQNLELGPYFDVAHQPTDIQWSPLVSFLVLFVLGLGVVVWMVAQVVKSKEATAERSA
jgi:hypothetical protein